MRRRFFGTSLLLIGLGVALGLVARSVLGPPESGKPFPRKYSEPIKYDSPQAVPEGDSEEVDDSSTNQNLPIDSTMTPADAPAISGGLVPPLDISVRRESGSSWARVDFSPFEHDERALFEPHGTQVCASGCALSRHPTGKLTEERFTELLRQFVSEDATAASRALDELVYFGPQSRRWLALSDAELVHGQDASRLRRELERDHVQIQIRLLDEDGVVRSWLPPTRVPLDRRHVFDMETSELPPLVTSGTVKRVGRDYLWVRL